MNDIAEFINCKHFLTVEDDDDDDHSNDGDNDVKWLLQFRVIMFMVFIVITSMVFRVIAHIVVSGCKKLSML